MRTLVSIALFTLYQSLCLAQTDSDALTSRRAIKFSKYSSTYSSNNLKNIRLTQEARNQLNEHTALMIEALEENNDRKTLKTLKKNYEKLVDGIVDEALPIFKKPGNGGLQDVQLYDYQVDTILYDSAMTKICPLYPICE